MVFLELEDFDSKIRSEYLDKIIDSDPTILDKSELQQIAEIESFISTRYNTTEIFSQVGTNRNDFIIGVMLSLVIRDIMSRINARNVPEFIENRYEEAINKLIEVNNQTRNPVGLPELTDEDGNRRDYLLISSSPKNYYEY